MQQMKRHIGIVIYRILRAWQKRFLLRIIHIPYLLRHQMPKHKVYRSGNPASAAEVLVQNHFGRISVLLRVIKRIVVFAPQKDCGHGLPESINALLNVADDKQVFPITADGAKNQILNFVCILVFIDHNLCKTGGYVLCGLCKCKAVFRFFQQKMQRPMFQVVIICKVFFAFQPAVFFCKEANRAEKLVYNG